MTHMKQLINNIVFLTGNRDMLEMIPQIPVLPTWDQRTIDFFSEFSRKLLSNPKTRQFNDIVSYAFWIRKASLTQIKNHYYSGMSKKIGRGMAFHIAPSNVPVNFAVSFTSSLLAGNINVVRLSNKAFDQVNIIIDALRSTFSDGFEDFEKYLLLVRYDHNEEVTDFLSSLCDVRIIWGGNQTIKTVRKSALPPRAIEMSFADRHSIAVLNYEAVIDADIERLVSDFYIDTYYMDQNACSSPRIIIWMGYHVDKAKVLFWGAVRKLVYRDYEFRDIQAIDKFDQFCQLAAINPDVILQNEDNLVMRIDVDRLDEKLMDYKFGGGYFFEYKASGFEELIPIMGKNCQTISYFGIDGHEIEQFVIEKGLRGVDRIVPVGKTMDLTFKWDGFDMIDNMSRYVYCPDYYTVNHTDEFGK